MEVKIVNKSKHPLPKYETEGSAGMDVRANIIEELELKPNEVVVVPTGLFIELPVGFELQIRPRSGLAAKFKITVLNAPGTIDSDYRGEIGVILINQSKNIYVVEDGDRIAQMVIARYERVEWSEGEVLNETLRGEGKFGSTGKK